MVRKRDRIPNPFENKDRAEVLARELTNLLKSGGVRLSQELEEGLIQAIEKSKEPVSEGSVERKSEKIERLKTLVKDIAPFLNGESYFRELLAKSNHRQIPEYLDDHWNPFRRAYDSASEMIKDPNKIDESELDAVLKVIADQWPPIFWLGAQINLLWMANIIGVNELDKFYDAAGLEWRGSWRVGGTVDVFNDNVVGTDGSGGDNVIEVLRPGYKYKYGNYGDRFSIKATVRKGKYQGG